MTVETNDATLNAPLSGMSGYRRDVLRVLAECERQSGNEAPNGREVLSSLAPAYGEEPNPSRLYPNLDALEDAGYVATERNGRSKHYTLTPKGRVSLREDARRTAELLGGDGE